MEKTAAHTTSRLTATVLKAMGLFSGLQLFNIVCSVIKMKLVAIWLHATGVGLFGIYQSVTDTISTLTDMGIRQSAVRDVAAHRNLAGRLSRVAAVVRKWSLLAGLLGAVVIMGASPLLSHWFFNSSSGVWGFILLGAAMFLNSVTGGRQALLQGAGKLRKLARGNLWGTAAGLAASVPLFRFCQGEMAVVLSILAYSIAMYTAMRSQHMDTDREPEAISLKEMWSEGRGFVRLGLCMAIAAFVTNLAHAVFVALLSTFAGTEQVGYVQAGDTVIVRYIGLVFTAIGMEFYPRLAAAAHNRRIMQTYVNHESLLLLLLLTPLLLMFIMLRETVVHFLYAPEFMVIIPMITWGALSSIPKAVSWCMAFTIVSRGDGKIYVLTESLDALVSVPLCYFAYTTYGLAGLGWAYIIWYLLYTLITGTVYYGRYDMRLSNPVLLLCVLSTAVCTGGILLMELTPAWLSCPIITAVAACFIPPLLKLLRK